MVRQCIQVVQYLKMAVSDVAPGLACGGIDEHDVDRLQRMADAAQMHLKIEGQDVVDRNRYRPLTRGRIGLELEYAEVQFRRIELRRFARTQVR